MTDKPVFTNKSENQFWLQMLGDDARFIFNALSPAETAEVEKARSFINLFDHLLAQARQKSQENTNIELNRQSYQAAQDFRTFTLQLIRRQLQDKIILSLGPSFLNHIVSKTEQYLLLLSSYMQNKVPVFDAAGISLLWLFDMYVNALTLHDGLDATIFDQTKTEVQNIANTIQNLYLEANIINGLRRSGLNDFPALTSFNDDVQKKMINFAEYIVYLMQLMKEKKVLGNLTSLYLDNMYRQVCYYMTKLSTVSEIKMPVCDPANPRQE